MMCVRNSFTEISFPVYMINIIVTDCQHLSHHYTTIATSKVATRFSRCTRIIRIL